jgi:transcription elongation factor Elf1
MEKQAEINDVMRKFCFFRKESRCHHTSCKKCNKITEKVTDLFFKIDNVSSWYDDVARGNAQRYAAKLVTKVPKIT